MTLSKAATGIVRAGGGIYNIGFNGDEETQFSAYNLKELVELWRGFCEENSIKKNSVDYVERI